MISVNSQSAPSRRKLMLGARLFIEADFRQHRPGLISGPSISKLI
jgi:hypothetical protein